MTKRDKLIRFFLSYPSEASFDEVRQLLILFKFEEVRSKGSHHIFRHPDGRRQIVPKKHGQRVKEVYIKQIINLLRLE